MTGPFERHFIIEGQFLGTADCDWKQVHEEKQPPRSYALFCPVCAEVWARCPVQLKGSEKVQEFQVFSCHCRKHASPYRILIPGTLFLTWDRSFNESFPLDVVRREFELHLALYPENV